MTGQAENKANISFSYKKYYSFRNRINERFAGRYYSDMQIPYIAEVLREGDVQPAVVLSAAPLLVAAYSDEFDAVVILRFPDFVNEKFKLSEGARLTTSCVYFSEVAASDLFPGERAGGNFGDFLPIVHLFLGANDDKIKKKTELFDEALWARVQSLGKDYLLSHAGLFRDGFYYFKKD